MRPQAVLTEGHTVKFAIDLFSEKIDYGYFKKENYCQARLTDLFRAINRGRTLALAGLNFKFYCLKLLLTFGLLEDILLNLINNVSYPI